MKGIVKTVTKNGVFNGMDKYDIEFNHTQGEKIMFFSKTKETDENFPYKIGNEINYELKPNGNGKLIRTDNFTQAINSLPTKKMDFTSVSIITQVCYKANKEVFARDYDDLVQQKTTNDVKWMINLINQTYGSQG